MLERVVEKRLKALEGYGFDVLKLVCPGFAGVPDRMIVAPKWSPAPPAFVECKAPGKRERALQEAVRDDWRKQGMDVRDMVDTPSAADALCNRLLVQAVERVKFPMRNSLPPHILAAYQLARAACWHPA